MRVKIVATIIGSTRRVIIMICASDGGFENIQNNRIILSYIIYIYIFIVVIIIFIFMCTRSKPNALKSVATVFYTYNVILYIPII